MGQAAALSGLIGLTGPLAIVLKPPPVTWLGLISANIGYFIYAPLLSIGSSPRGRLRRRHGHHPLDGRRSFRARRRELLHALRLRIPGPAEHGRMGDLRSGQRVRQSARVHRAGERADSSGRTRSVWQRLSAGYLPGHAVPQRRASHRRPRAARSYCRAAAEQAEPAAHVERGRARPLRRGQEMEATIANYELAFRMQSEVPELVDLKSESETTRKLYGLDSPDTEEFGRECLLARRMVERGVRFIELLTPFRFGLDRWDQHGNLEAGHRTNAKAVDQPIAALLRDLKARGLLGQTLVVWGGEFGRTPCEQFAD